MMIILLTIFCIMGVLGLCGSLIGLAFRASWGIFKVLFSIVLFPIMLIGLIVAGVFQLAIPLLIIAGIISIFSRRRVYY